jgi:hypothetical protein
MFKIVLLAVVAYSYGSDWAFGGDDGGGLTLGEISIDHHGGFELGGTGLNESFSVLLRYSECTICVMSASFIRKSCIAGNVAS